MSDIPNIPEDAADWLALTSIKGVGAARCGQLIAAFGTPRAALAAAAADWQQLPGIGMGTTDALKSGPDHKLVAEQLRLLERSGASMAVLGGDDYPRMLSAIPDCPPFFFYRGQFTPADENAVAIVGARTPTPYGRKMATKLADGLAHAGLTITSGLAEGVDGLAHRAALAAGGRTIAVFGCGLDIVYPREHRALAEQIVEAGVLISEFPFGTAPSRTNFPKRNRIISGLSRGVVIIEARGRSGALLTADHALDQNRDVFAVPGAVGSELSVGTNNLIKAGAQLVTDANDVLKELDMQYTSTIPRENAAPLPVMTPIQEKVYSVLGESPCHIDQLSINLAVSVGELSSILLDLELIGVAGQAAGKKFYKLR